MDFTKEETYRLTRVPVQLAHTLTPEAYRSTAYFEIERERVFATSWVCVGYTSQVAEPGDTLVASVGDQPIFVVRDRQGGLRAFYNVCRHRGSQLVDSDGQNQLIRCPYHAWGYSLEGKLLGTPYFKGLDVPEAERRFYDTSFESTAYWCAETQTGIGPDGIPANPQFCQGDRSCCRH